jgi:hypothetical protein
LVHPWFTEFAELAKLAEFAEFSEFSEFAWGFRQEMGVRAILRIRAITVCTVVSGEKRSLSNSGS